MLRRWKLSICAIVLALSMTGCAQVVGGIVDTTTRRVGEEIGERIAGALLADLGPRLIRSYTIGLMQLLFYQSGYDTALPDYEPGDYTVWESETSEFGQTMERAFLRRDDEGREWWRIEAYSLDPDTGEEFHVIMEGLFRVEEDGTRYIRRLRVKYPDSDEPEEVAITEDEADRWVVRAESLTEESMEGMRVGEEEIVVPAGTFQTTRYQTDPNRFDGIETTWWVTEEAVPGRVVKMRHVDVEDETVTQNVDLVQYGSDATESILGAF